MMTYATISKERSDKFAEVFTPAGTVFEMLIPNFNDLLRDPDKTIFDPAVGEGQFPCAELVLKLFFNVERLDEELVLRALKSLYAMDIQATSVVKARNHLIATLQDAFRFFTGNEFTRLDEARAIVEKNIMVDDSLKAMREWANPQQSLF